MKIIEIENDDSQIYKWMKCWVNKLIEHPQEFEDTYHEIHGHTYKNLRIGSQKFESTPTEDRLTIETPTTILSSNIC